MGEFTLQIAKAHICPPALREVMNEAGENPLPGDPRFTHRELDWKGVAVSVPGCPHPHDPDDHTSAGFAIILQVAVMPFTVGRRHEHRNVLANNFRLGVAEHFFRSGTERKDDTDLIDQHHGVGNSCEDGSKMLLAARPALIERLIHSSQYNVS